MSDHNGHNFSRRTALKSAGASALALYGFSSSVNADDDGEIKRSIQIDLSQQDHRELPNGIEQVSAELFDNQDVQYVSINQYSSGGTEYLAKGSGEVGESGTGVTITPVASGADSNTVGYKLLGGPTTTSHWGNTETAEGSWNDSAYESTVWAQSGTNESGWLSDKVYHSQNFDWSGQSGDFGFYSGGWCIKHVSNDSGSWNQLNETLVDNHETNNGASYLYKSSSRHEYWGHETKLVVETVMNGDGTFDWWAKIYNEQSDWGAHFEVKGTRNPPDNCN
jgi:hypothetical protein